MENIENHDANNIEEIKIENNQLDDKEINKINMVKKTKKRNKDVYKIELRNAIKAKLIYLAIKQNKEATKQNLEEMLNNLIENKITEEFKKETVNEQ